MILLNAIEIAQSYHEQTDIIILVMYGNITHRCHKKEFLLQFDKDKNSGFIGCLKQRNAMVYVFKTTW